VFLAFSLANVIRATTACNVSFLIWPDGSAPAAFASLLFDPPEPQIIGKNTVFHDFPTFSRTCIFVLMSLSLLWSSLFYSSCLSDSSHLCFSSVHIVGSLTSKLPSIILCIYLWLYMYIYALYIYCVFCMYIIIYVYVHVNAELKSMQIFYVYSIYVYVYTFVYMYINMYMCISICICVYTHIYICTVGVNVEVYLLNRQCWCLGWLNIDILNVDVQHLWRNQWTLDVTNHHTYVHHSNFPMCRGFGTEFETYKILEVLKFWTENKSRNHTRKYLYMFYVSGLKRLWTFRTRQTPKILSLSLKLARSTREVCVNGDLYPKCGVYPVKCNVYRRKKTTPCNP